METKTYLGMLFMLMHAVYFVQAGIRIQYLLNWHDSMNCQTAAILNSDGEKILVPL